jgi:putative oxidoreductase
MIEMLVSTNPDWVLTIARLVIGIIFFAHGAQKMLGWFGGQGLKATVQGLNKQLGVPTPVAILVVSAEFFGGVGLIVGLLSRIAAAAILVTMLGAVATVHYSHGLFMDWYGNQKGHGFEYHLLAIALALVITVKGAGTLSIDRLLYQHYVTQSSAVQELQGNDYDPSE